MYGTDEEVWGCLLITPDCCGLRLPEVRPYLSPDRLWEESDVDMVCSEWLEAPRAFPPRRRAANNGINKRAEEITYGATDFIFPRRNVQGGSPFGDVPKSAYDIVASYVSLYSSTEFTYVIHTIECHLEMSFYVYTVEPRIVAYAFTLLWDNLCRNSCISKDPSQGFKETRQVNTRLLPYILFGDNGMKAFRAMP